MESIQKREGSARHLCPYTECTSTFSTAFNLRRHIDINHLRIKRFQCPFCLRRFVTKQTLTDHINSHTGERPFACEICSARYRHSSKLSFHRRKHKLAGEIPDAPRPRPSLTTEPTSPIPDELLLPPIRYCGSFDCKLPHPDTFLT